MPGVMPPGKGALSCELGLRLRELLRRDEGGHARHRQPLLGRGRHHRGRGPTNRAQRRMAPARRAGAPPSGKDLAGIAGVGQEAAQGRGRPVRPARGRGDPQRAEVLGQAEEAGMVLDEAGEQLLDHHGLGRLDGDAGRIAGAIGIQASAVRSSGPGQQATGAELHLPSSTHALSDQGALILRHRTPDLQQEVILRVLPHGSVRGARPGRRNAPAPPEGPSAGRSCGPGDRGR